MKRLVECFQSINKSRFFRRNIFLHLFTILIPIVVFSFVSLSQFTATLENELNQTGINHLNTVRNVYDVKIKELRALAARLSDNPTLTVRKMKSSPVEVIEELQKYGQTYEVMRSIILYERGSEKLFTPEGTYLLNVELPSYVKFKDWSKDDFVQMLNTCNEPVLKYVSTAQQTYLLYFAPLPASVSNPTRTLVLIIDNERLVKTLNFSINAEYENIFMFDRHMTVLNQFKPVEAYWLEAVKAICKEQPVSTEVISVDGMQHRVTSMYSADTGIHYVRCLSEEYASQTMRRHTNIAYVCVSAMLICGVLLIVLNIHLSIIPVKKLSDIASTTLNGTEDQSELEQIASVLSAYGAYKETYEVSMSESLAARREAILMAALNGMYESIDELRLAGGKVGLSFKNEMFVIASLMTDANISAAEFAEILQSAETAMQPEIECYFKKLPAECRGIFLICLSSEELPLLRQRLQAFQEQVQTINGITISIGVSCIGGDIAAINKLYLQSNTALKHRMIYGRDNIIYMSSLLEQGMHANYPTKALQQFEKYMSARDGIAARRAMNSIIEHLKANSCSVFVAQCVFFDIVHVFKQLTDQLDAAYTPEIEMWGSVEELEGSLTLEDLNAQIETVFDRLDSFQQSHQTNSNHEVCERILAYISEHCFEYGFQISQVAEEFSMSVQYLRDLFKEAFGETPLNYITKLKIEKAKELLTTTNHTLPTITEMVGNVDVSNFSRKFKQQTGMTPGQYREKNSNNSIR